MKKLITLLLLIACCLQGSKLYAQLSGSNTISFEYKEALWPQLITIDTVNYHHNQWQVGRPGKKVFDTAYDGVRALVTDTANAYAPNDTSVFILHLPSRVHPFGFPSWADPWLDQVAFRYRFNLDTTSIVLFEFSADTGRSWINMQDSTPRGLMYDTLDLKTPGWHSWHTYVTGLSYYYSGNDSFLFRFTFISGNDTMSRDGWMIDNFYINYYIEGVAQTAAAGNEITIYPNPAAKQCTIVCNGDAMKQGQATLWDAAGRQVSACALNGRLTTIPLTGLPNGYYECRIKTSDGILITRPLIVQQ